MRAPDRDRRRYRIAALCLALILLSGAAAALSADYTVFPNGTAYTAAIEVTGVERYQFTEPGMLGEDVPMPVSAVSVGNGSGAVAFTEEAYSAVSFPEKGNYTIRYTATIQDRFMQVAFHSPYNVTLYIPPEFDVRNPVLGSTLGGRIEDSPDGGTFVVWNSTRYFECRFYDSFQEKALVIFGTVWIAICLIFLIPFISQRLWRQPQLRVPPKEKK